MSLKLTDKAIIGLKYKGQGLCTYWDSTLQTFGVRVYPTGKKVYVLRISGGKDRLIKTFAKFGEIKTKDARELAATLKHKQYSIYTQFKKPIAQITFKELSTRFLELHSKKFKKTWKEDIRCLDKDILPFIGKKNLSAITTSDILQLQSSKPKFMSNKIIRLIKAMFNKAKQWKLYTEENPCNGIKLASDTKRKRFISEAEMPRLLAAIKDKPKLVEVCVWMFLLTGMRRSELLGLHWKDIWWNEKFAILHQTKSGQEQNTPLSDKAIELLQSIRTGESSAEDKIFPWSDFKRPWHRIRKAAELEDVRIHDLRRTFASWLAMENNSLHIIGQLLHHSQVSTTAIYARLQTHPLAKASNELANKILSCEIKENKIEEQLAASIQ